MKIKVLIADDHSFIREGMKIILTSFSDFEVVGAGAGSHRADCQGIVEQGNRQKAVHFGRDSRELHYFHPE